MRVTNNMRQAQVLRSLQTGLAELAKAQNQVATGKRFTSASEDPVAAAQVMRADRALRGIEQYRRNGAAVRVRLDAEEAVLDQVTDLLTRAKELAVSQGSDTATPATRSSTAAEVDRLLEQVIALGNTKVGDEYVFGGHQVTAPPFQADGAYLGDDGIRQAELGPGYLVDANHTGRQLLESSGVVASLVALRDALRSGSGTAVSATIDDLDAAFGKTQTLLAETGARLRQIEVAAANLDASESSLELRKADEQGISIEEATTRMLAVQTSLHAALLSTERLLSLSLTEYLR